MEVKSIFVNYIMRTYEKQRSSTLPIQNDKMDNEIISDMVSISPHANKRLFGDIMEHSLKKGLSEVLENED